MLNACEYYAWFDFRELLEETIFLKADSVELIEVGHYDYSVKVVEDGEETTYDKDEIIDMWYLVEDRLKVDLMHVDNSGVWIIYDYEVII